MLNKCFECPALRLKWACPAKYRPHPRYCELTDHPGYRANILKYALADRVPLHIDNILNKPPMFFRDKFISLALLVDDTNDGIARISDILSKDIPHIYVVGAGMEVQDEYLSDEQLSFCAATSYPFVFDTESIKNLLSFANVAISYGVDVTETAKAHPDIEFLVIGAGNDYGNVRYISLNKFCKKYESILYKIIENRKFENKPSTKNKIFTFVSSMIQYAASGFENADLSVSNQRIKICEECPDFIPFNRSCQLCGCYMDLKTKIAASECPLKKWLSVQEMKEQPKGCGCNK